MRCAICSEKRNSARVQHDMLFSTHRLQMQLLGVERALSAFCPYRIPPKALVSVRHLLQPLLEASDVRQGFKFREMKIRENYFRNNEILETTLR